MAHWASIAYVACAVVLTWPLLLHVGTALPGWQPGDQALYVWTLDSVLTSVADGTSPFFSSRLFVPIGVNLTQVATSFTLAPLAAPLWWGWGTDGLVAFYGLMVLAAPAVLALGMRELVATLTGNEHAAFWAGVLGATSPAFVSFLHTPLYPQVTGAALLPWAFATLVRWQRSPTMRRAITATALAWSLALTDYYCAGMFAAGALPILVIGWQPAQIRSMLVALGANAVVAALLVSVAPPVDFGDIDLGGFWGIANANLRDFLTPAWDVARGVRGTVDNSGIWWDGVAATLARGRLPASDSGPDPDSYYFGIGPLVLVMFGLLRRPSRGAWAFAIGGVLVMLLACGERVLWGDVVLWEGPTTPWSWAMEHVFALRAYDIPRRFALGATIMLLTVTGCGLATLRSNGRRATIAATIVLLEYARLGMPISTIEVPPVYEDLTARADGRTLLELPRGIAESKGAFAYGSTSQLGMYWQTIHRHPTVAGYVSRVPRSTYNNIAREPVLGAMMLMASQWDHWFVDYGGIRHEATSLGAYEPEVVDRFVRKLNLGYVVFAPNERRDFYLEEVSRVLGSRVESVRTYPDGYALLIVREGGTMPPSTPIEAEQEQNRG